jgi:Amino-terminal Zinc-binding domain of ubiquitin ligase E3A
MACTQKLCFTWREMFTRHPVRRPSHITARIMAYALATGDDPYGKLCSEKPTLLPEDLDLGADLQVAIREKLPITSLRFAFTLYSDEPQNDQVFCVEGLSDQWYRVVEKNGQMLQIKHPNQSQALWDYWTNSLDMDGKSRVDRKSLQQKLFSSLAVKMLEWYPPVREMSTMQKLLHVKDGIIVGRTATALPLNVAHAEIARSISPQFPEAVQPVTAAVLSNDLLDELEIPLPLKFPSPGSPMDSNGFDTDQLEGSVGSVENAKSLKKDDPEKLESGTGDSHQQITHRKYTDNVLIDPKASEYDLMTPLEFTDRCAPPTCYRLDDVPDKVQDGLTELTVHSVGLHGQKLAEQAGLTELTWASLLALRDTCINALPRSRFGSGRPEDIDPKFWRYASNSLFQGLGTRHGLLRSFSEPRDLDSKTLWKKLDAFHWHRFAPDIILSYLWHGIEDLFIPPPTFTRKKKYKKRGKPDKQTAAPLYVEDDDAAHMIMICIYALVGSVRFVIRNDRVWTVANEVWLNHGRFLDYSKTFPLRGQTQAESEDTADMIDAFHSEAALRLASRLVKAISARRYFYERTLYPQKGCFPTAYHRQTTFPLMNTILKNLVRIEEHTKPRWSSRTGFRVILVFINWMRMLFMQNWNGQPQLNRSDVAGAAVEIMSEISEFDLFVSIKHPLSIKMDIFLE